MVDNYLPTFDMNEQLALDPEKKVDEHINRVKADIDSCRHWKPSALNADTFELVPQTPYTDEDLYWTTDGSRVNNEHDDESLRDIKSYNIKKDKNF